MSLWLSFCLCESSMRFIDILVMVNYITSAGTGPWNSIL